MKYQFQFAGANVNRRSSQPRKRLRLVLLVAAFIMAVLAYWQYLQHLAHGPRRVVSNVEPAAATAATAAAASTSATAATATTAAATTTPTTANVATASTIEASKSISIAANTETIPATKNITDTTGANLEKAQDKAQPQVSSTATMTATVAPAKPVEATPAATVTSVSTESTAQATATPESVPVMRISSEPPPPPRKPRVLTAEDRLMRAGTTAFNNVLDMASKYPDSYGFRAQDAFKDATLGKPIPVYTVDESDRAKYKSGQPVKPLLKKTDTWVFPVQVDDHVCCMVQVHYTGRDYVPGNASKLLGTAWNSITQKWPESEGYHPCIVVNQDIPGYFFTVPELPMQNMTDIVRLTSFHPSLSPADVILASWR